MTVLREKFDEMVYSMGKPAVRVPWLAIVVSIVIWSVVAGAVALAMWLL